MRSRWKETVAGKMESFKTIVAEHPHYRDLINNSDDPYFEMIELVDKHEKLSQFENIEDFEKKIRAEERAKVLAEKEAAEKDKDALKRSVPESLAGDNSKGGLKGSAWSGPAPLESILDG